MVVDVDVTLVEAARGGDQRAMEQLVEAYLPLVYNIVGRALSGSPDVDDVVQDSMLRVVRGISGLREPAGFRSWLVAVAMNQVREHHRTRTAAATPLDGFEDVADPGADFAELTVTELGLSGQRREVAQAVSWLDTDDQELLSLWWLVEAGHLTRAELVEAVQLDPHHVTVRVGRMKTQLDTARRVVRALAVAPTCPGLSWTALEWPGRPLGLWRKRFARHIRECPYCFEAAADLVPAERLLVSLALVPVPVGLTVLALEAARHAAAVTASTAALTDVGWARPTQPGSASHRRISRARAGGHRLGLPARVGLAVAVGAAVAGSVVLGTGIGSGSGTGAGSGSDTAQDAAGRAAARAISAPVSTPSAPSSPTPSAAATPSRAATSPTATPTRRPGTAAGTPTSRPPATTAAAAPAQGNQSAEDQVLAVINQARAAQGVPALSYSTGLNTSAARHTQTMAGGCGLSHQCPGEPDLGARETAAGVSWGAAGENIGDGGPQAATSSAIASMAVGLTRSMLAEQPPNDGHRRNILNPGFRHIGISVFRTASGTVYMTQDFSD